MQQLQFAADRNTFFQARDQLVCAFVGESLIHTHGADRNPISQTVELRIEPNFQ